MKPHQTAILVYIATLLTTSVNCGMIFELQLIQFSNPSSTTYLNEPCYKKDCQMGLLLCLVDLPFRNPQNCSLGDMITPVLTSKSSDSLNSSNTNYKFTIDELPPDGIGMMIEVRDYWNTSVWNHIDFYTSTLADVPLDALMPTTKVFSSLFNHNSTLEATLKLYCEQNYYGKNCQVFCEPGPNYVCDKLSGMFVCDKGFTGELCQIRELIYLFLLLFKTYPEF